MKKVAMIGVGKLGEPCAEVMSKYYDVVGYDIEPRNPKFQMVNSISEAVRNSDLIFVAAPTPHDSIYGGETPTSHLPNKDFDYTTTVEILKEINLYANTKQLVVLISTVLPGTVRNILKPYITNARFIYNPYLIAMGTVAYDFVNPEMVIIGTDNGDITADAKELIDFYKPMMQNDPRYEVGTYDEAECIKIFYNTFISTKISLVNMIQDVAETNGNINTDIVTDALARSTKRITGPAYMKAGMGDGGACHPRDNIALRYLAERLDLGYSIFDSIVLSREKQAERLAQTCLTHGKNITIVGKAYKPKVPYTHGSYSLLVGHYITMHGGNVHYYDVNTGENDLKSDWSEVYLIGYHDTFLNDIVFPGHATIIDPWRLYNSNDNKVIHYGNTRPKNTDKETIKKDLIYITDEPSIETSWDELKYQGPIDYGDQNKVNLVKIRQPTNDSISRRQTVLDSGIILNYPALLDGGGLELKDALIETIHNTSKEILHEHAFEWCAGFGVLGFELLGKGITGHVTFSDYFPLAIETCLQNAKDNKLDKYVSGYVSATIADLPEHKPFNLVVSNPPHVPSLDDFYKWTKEDHTQRPSEFYNIARLCVDHNWSIHREFFANIKKHCAPTADIYLIENEDHKILSHMAKLYGLYLDGSYKVKTSHENMHSVYIMHYKLTH